MACSIKLVRLDDFIADVDSIDLAADGYALAEDGYFPTVAPIGAKSVLETITLKLQGTSKDDLAAMTQEINDKIRQVQWWIEDPGVERYQVWIRVQQENETYARQAMILNIVPPENVRLFTPEEINQNYIGEYQIGIERTPFWEDPYPYPTTTAKTGINIIGSSTALSETVNGDVPARLAFVSLAAGSSQNITDAWMGWKSNRFGTSANFVPVWSLKDSSNLYNATTTASDTAAYSGTKITCTFTPATLIIRAEIEINQVAPSNPADQRGTYSVLLRAKMSDTSIARARIGYSFSAGAGPLSPIYRSRQIISGTAYKLYEMGKVSIPPFRIPNADTLTNFSIELDVERLSGSGAFDADCFILIPTDEGFVKLTSPVRITTNQRIAVLQAADDSLFSYVDYQAAAILSPVTAQPISWSHPLQHFE